MKICYVITKSNWGGAQRYIYDLATALPADYEPVVICGGEGELVNRLNKAGITVVKTKNLGRDISLLDDWRSFRQLLKIFRAEKPAIVHLNSSKAAGLGALAARIAYLTTKTYNLKPRIIYTVHGWPFNEKRIWPIRLVIKFFSWLTIGLATKVIVIARCEYEQVAGWPGVKAKLRLVYNGIESRRLPSRLAARAKLLEALHCPVDFMADKIVIGTVAELHRNKGLAYAIEAVGKFPDLIYFIVGEGEGREELEKLITAKASGQVFMPGFIPANEVLSAFDAFLLPSIKEGLPYVILEAGAVGLPVIASAVGGIPEIIENSVNGLLTKAGNVESLRQALAKIIEMSAGERKELGHKLADKVSTDFSTARMVKETVAVYNEQNK